MITKPIAKILFWYGGFHTEVKVFWVQIQRDFFFKIVLNWGNVIHYFSIIIQDNVNQLLKIEGRL